MTRQDEQECEEIMDALDTLIRKSIREHPRLSKAFPEGFDLGIELPDEEDDPLMKAMEHAELDLEREAEQNKKKPERTEEQAEHADEEHPDPARFPGTLAGFEAFLASPAMQRIWVGDLEQFKQYGIAFLLGHELPKTGEVPPEFVSAWAQKVDQQSRSMTADDRNLVVKAVARERPRIEPWKHDRSENGLDSFLKTRAMQRLRRDNPGAWRQHHLEFFAAMEPQPGPKAVSIKRLELEAECPDAPSTMAKSVGEGARLTTGQSVLVSNFGPDFGDPSRWLRSR